MFRYRKNHPATHLQRVLPDGSVRDIDIAGSPRGNARDALPMFLTIVAEPKDIPWGFQGLLSTRAAVGRLPLTGPELASYVDAMLNDWHEAPTPQREVVVWAVDFGKADITRLMLRAIADPLVAKYGKDNDIRLTHLDGSTETLDGEAATFIAAVTSQKPRLIVTTSHGATAPVDKPAQMQLTLGMPVDQRRRALVLADLLAGWEPDGVIWYAHACCGAGSSDLSDYVDLVQGDERVVSLLRGVSAIGESVAPLPMALLTAPKPARGFIGHVEPTFDWTIGSPLTGQHLTAALVNGLYDVLFQTQPMPLGFAMQEWYDGAATALGIWDEARKTLNKTGTATEDLLRSLLVARDRTGQVILGDPTVVLGPVHA